MSNKATSAAKAVGSAVLTVATLAYELPIRTRMQEIDDEIAKLQEERDQLAKKLDR